MPIKEKRVGTHRDNKVKSACHKERNKYAIHKERNKYAIHKKGESMRYIRKGKVCDTIQLTVLFLTDKLIYAVFNRI